MDALFLKLLTVFDELGLWKDGVELIGSWSFLLYQRHLGVRPLPLRTQDIDFLLPWPYPARSSVALSNALSKLGFHSASNADGSNYYIHPELKLEFLSPERGKGGLEARAIKPLGLRAVTLRFMDMLLKDSIYLEEGAVRVRVPKPLNFCLHKFIIAQRRVSSDKREKDIQQAVYVLAVLEPTAFKAGFEDLPPKWKKLAQKSFATAWDLFPLERPILARHQLAPQA
ncbi:MAG: nucleotidyltransferase domain-containing protein [Elusimicrobia bacterium]|nr:nucleotidyltransferase domain-containing protein [Elusimicrobiota bacterium]